MYERAALGAGQPPCVLVLDDDPFMLEMLKDFPGLGEIGAVEDGKTSVTFASVQDAQLAVAGKFSLIEKECTTSNWRAKKAKDAW